MNCHICCPCFIYTRLIIRFLVNLKVLVFFSLSWSGEFEFSVFCMFSCCFFKLHCLSIVPCPCTQICGCVQEKEHTKYLSKECFLYLISTLPSLDRQRPLSLSLSQLFTFQAHVLTCVSSHMLYLITIFHLFFLYLWRRRWR